MRWHRVAIAAAFMVISAWLASRDVRVAVVAAEGESTADLAALIESRLNVQGGVALVERSAVESILREQKLQALFAPEAVDRRAALGKLLRADLLVMLRKAAQPEKGYEVVTCETSHGLRLCGERLAAIGEASGDVAQLQSMISQALRKHAETVSQIIAVPPLVSNDLSFSAQPLQRPLAKIIERAFIGRPGVVVVELAEAKALAAEIALAGAPGIERDAPLYLLGDFKHANFSNDSPIDFHLRLLRGAKEIGARTVSRVKPADAAVAVSQLAGKMLDEAVGRADAMPVERDEAAQLAARAQTMYRAESWSEAVDLAEASLLLAPSQPAMHRLAAHALALEARSLQEANVSLPKPTIEGRDSQSPDNRDPVQALYAQGLPHLEEFLSAATFTMKNDFAVLSPYLHHCSGRAAMRSMLIRILAAKQAADRDDETIRYCLEFADTSGKELSPEEFKLWKHAAARAWPGAADPDGQRLARFMAWNEKLSDRDKLDELVRSLRGLESPTADRAAQALAGMAVEIRNPSNADRIAPAAELRYLPLRKPIWGALAVSTGEPRKVAGTLRVPSANVAGTLRVPSAQTGNAAIIDSPVLNGSLDVAWGNGSLYLWPSGKSAAPQPMLRIAAEPGGTPVCYDGQFVWAYATHGTSAGQSSAQHDDAGLAVFDPMTQRTTLLGPDCGFPADKVRSISIATLARGKVCVVAHIGPSVGGRVWIAIATYSASGGGKVNVFHEAKDFKTSDPNDWKNPHLSFNSSRTHALRATRGGAERSAVLVERGALGHPLLIDPETLKVRVIEEPVRSEFPSQIVQRDGALYWVGRAAHGFTVCRYALPELKIEQGRQQFERPGSLFLFKQGAGVILPGELWLAADPMGDFKSVPLRADAGVKMSASLQALASENHGLLLTNFAGTYELVLPSARR